MKLKHVWPALAFAISAGAADAAVVLHYSGGAPVDDTDGIVGIEDIDTTDNATLVFDILTDAAIAAVGTAQPQWAFEVLNADSNEIARLSVTGAGTNVTSDATPFGFAFILDRDTAYAAGDFLGQITVLTADVGLKPHDEIPDLILAGYEDSTTPLLVSGPASGIDQVFVGYDVQEVPIPAAAWLMAGGLLALGAVRRRRPTG